ncbi:MAG: phosphodiester glycosidase family protein, partial [Bacteroidetes bacterium]|nr:phosphodiester glycosidase family protein [Bacteroidota bacterium]
MKQLLSVLTLLLLTGSSLLAAGDTVSTEIIAPGVVHTQYTLPGPYTLDVLEVDVKNPHITFETYKPAGGLTKTTVQAAANDRAGHRVIGAVNADFFSFETGWPINNQVVNGKPVLGQSTVKSQFVFTKGRKAYIDGFSFAGKVIAANNTTASIQKMNYTRAADQMQLYTSYKGATTGTDASGSEAVLQLLSPDWVMNDTLRFIVAQKGTGNSSIPANGAVLSGAGTAATFITTNIAAGDTIRLVLNYNPRTAGTSVREVMQVIAGNGRIIKDGVPYPTIGDYDGSGQSFNDARHPRTFIGQNADSSKVYLCTVDGRQASSIGMNFAEMAAFLQKLGITNAFNLDGGGSTTMVVRGNVVNSPSDPGGERSVANTLQVISTAPVGTLHFLDMRESRAEVFQGLTAQFHADGRDEYYNPLPLPGEVVWSCDSAIGTISATGLFSAKNVNDSGWVFVRYNTIADSARVYVRIVKEIRLYPTALSMVPGEQVVLSIRGIDTGNNGVVLEGDQVFTSISGPGIHYLNSTRTVTASGFGKGTFAVTLDTVTTKINYDFTGNDTTLPVERFHDLFLWRQDVTGTDPDNVFFGLSADTVVSAPHAYRVFYSFPTADAVTASLLTDLPLASRPDSLYLKVYGNGGGHQLQLQFTDKDGELFSITSPTAVTWNGSWQNVGFKMVNAKPVTAGTLDFPITLKEVRIAIGETGASGSKAVGTIFLDDIMVHYPNRAVAPQVLFDFNAGVTGWLQPSQGNTAQLVGIVIASSSISYSTEHPYEGSGSGKFTYVDDAASTADWNVRITRGTTSELGSMLRGSYIGAWIWADGTLNITLRTVIRDGNGQICSGPAFPVNHVGWKLIGTKLDENLFTPYLTAGKITDTGNKFNGFRLQAAHADVNGKTKSFFVDKMVNSALTVPSGFIDFGAAWDSTGNQVKVSWGVNSEISINRYVVERSTNGVAFPEVGSVTAKGNTDTTARYTFYDNIGSLTSATYRIRQITNDGGQVTTPSIAFSLTGVDGGHFSPLTFSLEQNYPNPFNPTTTIPFRLPAAARTNLTVYDILGRKISTLLDQEVAAGSHAVTWDSSNVASGIYFYRLSSGNYVDTKK